MAWFLQIFASGCNVVGKGELTLQFLHEHPTGKPRFQWGFLPTWRSGCWKLVLVVENMALPRFSVSLRLKSCLLLQKFQKPLKGTSCRVKKPLESMMENGFYLVFLALWSEQCSCFYFKTIEPNFELNEDINLCLVRFEFL